MTIRLTNRLFGTHPIVVHCPGALPEGWAHLERAVLGAPPRRCPCPDLTVLTWAAGEPKAKPNGTLERSLERLGVRPLVLGREVGDWRNIHKIRLTAEALRRVSTPYVAGLDSSDVLVLDDPGLLVERLRAHFTCDLVFNATGPPCWPVLPEFIHFESSLPMAAVAHGRHWLNAGAWVGSTPVCREFFGHLATQPPVEGYEWSEQALVKRAWPRWYPRVQIDSTSILFQWFKENPSVLRFERPTLPRQAQLLDLLRPLGADLRGAEVGVHDGYTSDVLLGELPGLVLWLVDPWMPYRGRDSFEDHDRAAFLRARSRADWWTSHAQERRFFLEEPSPRAARRFADGSLDFAYIDANHLYESVSADIAAWWPKVKEGGYLCGHDYRVYGDAQGLWGVSRAVDEFAASVGRDVGAGKDGVWWIRKRAGYL